MENVKSNVNTEELKKLCQPLVDWLYENGNPHTRIIVDMANAEVVEGQAVVGFELRD